MSARLDELGRSGARHASGGNFQGGGCITHIGRKGDGPECLKPGDRGTVVLRLSYYDFGPGLYRTVVPGARFIMVDGPVVIAQGEVLDRWESQTNSRFQAQTKWSTEGIVRTFLIATAAMVSLVPVDASGKCMSLVSRFEPASGAVVPSAPVLRLFVPAHRVAGLPVVTATDAAGRAVKVVVTSESATDAFNSYRVSFGSLAKGDLMVRFVDKYDISNYVAYTVDPAWAAPKAVPPKVKVTRTETSWTCSHQLTRNLEFSSVAPAYRVSFAANKAALASPVSSIVLPANVQPVWNSSEPVKKASIEIGHVDCMGYTHKWSGGMWVRVTALRPDGSETDVVSALWLEPP